MDVGTLKTPELSRSPEVGLAGDAPVRAPARPQAPASSDPVPVQTPQAVEQAQPLQGKALEQVVADMQDFVQSVQRNINFSLDDDSGRVVINVTERETGEVIRQIPSEDALRLAENLAEIRSLLFSAEA